MAEVTINVRANRTRFPGLTQEVEATVELPVELRLIGLGVFVGGLLDHVAHAAVTDGAKVTELAESLECTRNALWERVGSLADSLHKIEKDLDSRVDYALRQLGAIDAPRGEELEMLERRSTIQGSVVSYLAARDSPTRCRDWRTTGGLHRALGWPMIELESALEELAASGELERRVNGPLKLWSLPEEEIVDMDSSTTEGGK